MERAKRARTAETPKQPSLCLRLRAPYFYPDYGEGVATHTGPESCAVTREGRGEALTGVRAGQVWSGESNVVRGADAVVAAEGNRIGSVSARTWATPRRLRPWHVRTLLVREPGDLWIGHRPCWGRMVRSGKVRNRSR